MASAFLMHGKKPLDKKTQLTTSERLTLTNVQRYLGMIVLDTDLKKRKILIADPQADSTQEIDWLNLEDLYGSLEKIDLGGGRYGYRLKGNTNNVGVNAIMLSPGGVAQGESSFCVGDSEALGAYSQVFGVDNVTEGAATGAILIGGGNEAFNSGSYGLGSDNSLDQGVAIGVQNEVSVGGVAIGERCVASSEYAVAIGEDCEASDQAAISIGKDSHASGSSAVTLGAQNEASGRSSIAINKLTKAIGDNSFAGGTGFDSANKNTTSGSVAFSFQEVTETKDAVGANSAILGGIDNSTTADAVGSVVLGGIDQRAIKPHTVYMTFVRLKPSVSPKYPEEGTIYYDSSTHTLKCYDGTNWNDLY